MKQYMGLYAGRRCEKYLPKIEGGDETHYSSVPAHCRGRGRCKRAPPGESSNVRAAQPRPTAAPEASHARRLPGTLAATHGSHPHCRPRPWGP